jgi:hypothetical protein
MKKTAKTRNFFWDPDMHTINTRKAPKSVRKVVDFLFQFNEENGEEEEEEDYARSK